MKTKFTIGEKVFDTNRLIGDLKSQVRVPAAKRGRCEIVHKIVKVGEPITVVSMRNSLFMGYKPIKVCFDVPHKLTQLLEDGGVWMTDSPQEIFGAAPGIDTARGDVLIGGLGIGYVAQIIADKPTVGNVVVVEKSRDVISLVAPYLGKDNVRVVHADLYTYLRTTAQKFDYCYFDIWSSTGERELANHVDPLRKLARRVLNHYGRVKCWGEEEMLGQRRYGQETRRRWEQMQKKGVLKR